MMRHLRAAHRSQCEPQLLDAELDESENEAPSTAGASVSVSVSSQGASSEAGSEPPPLEEAEGADVVVA